MKEEFSRTELILGKGGIKKLESSSVIIFGIGGVGSYAAEALSRSGIGFITIVDDDRISLSNINRQLYALHSTIGKYKVDVAKERILDINPLCKVEAIKVFFNDDSKDSFDFSCYDYVVDCIDYVAGKVQIAVQAINSNTPIISCMGAGNKIDPSKLEIADLKKTSVCPLSRVMRQKLRERGIEHLKVVYSKELPIKIRGDNAVLDHGRMRQAPGSTSFVPAAAGLLLASEVIKDLLNGTVELP